LEFASRRSSFCISSSFLSTSSIVFSSSSFRTVAREELDDYIQKYKLENKSNIKPEKKFITKKEADAQYMAVKEILKKSGVSLGEANVEYYLQLYGIKYTTQYEIHINGSRHLFDFAISNGKKIVAFIEFDGRQHFEPVPEFGGAEALHNRQNRDSINDAYCEKFRINMVRIPYNSSNRTNSIIKKEILPLLKIRRSKGY
jgi:very-short-patch-repair endonuclease